MKKMNNVGRPKIPEKERKVKTTIWLKPSTVDKIDRLKKKKKCYSRGDVIDLLIQERNE